MLQKPSPNGGGFVFINMGFNKCIVPSIDYIHTIILQNGIDSVIKRYKKCDCLIGSPDAINLLNGLIEKDEQLKPDDQIPL
jgi:hypothetical protein